MLVGDLNDLLFVTRLEMFPNSLPLALVISFVALGAGVIFPFYRKQRTWNSGKFRDWLKTTQFYSFNPELFLVYLNRGIL